MSMRQLKISKSITSRESPSLEKYLKEIAKVDMLSHSEEVELTSLIKKGDKVALDKLTKANLRFVVSVAKQYQGQGLPLCDLINEGNLGLIKAAKKFDDTRGFRFISFAVWWIRQNILFALAADAKVVRVPMNKVVLSSRIRKTSSSLEQHLERLPDAEELAEAMNLKVEDVKFSMDHSCTSVSLDAPTNVEEDSCLLDVMENSNSPYADQELSHTESLQTEIVRTLSILPEKQRETLCCFFGIGMERSLSLEDIARKFDLTTERVRQIKDAAIYKLRANQNFKLLRCFLGN